MVTQERNLQHPIRRAQSNFPELLHGSDNDDGFPRHLDGYHDKRTNDQNTDEKREGNRGAGCGHTFADQPLASGPGREGEYTGPCKCRQERPQDPNCDQHQYGDEKDAAEQPQRR
jgi:hypothetical protein